MLSGLIQVSINPGNLQKKVWGGGHNTQNTDNKEDISLDVNNSSSQKFRQKLLLCYQSGLSLLFIDITDVHMNLDFKKFIENKIGYLFT